MGEGEMKTSENGKMGKWKKLAQKKKKKTKSSHKLTENKSKTQNN